jgi:hypothetical protein
LKAFSVKMKNYTLADVFLAIYMPMEGLAEAIYPE